MPALGGSSAGQAEIAKPDERRVVTDAHRINPKVLAYLMGPVALVTILVLRHFGLVASEPLWLWLGLFVAIPLGSFAIDVPYRSRPTRTLLQLRVAWHVASVTAVIYLTGWGPIMIGAFAFVALENISSDGSRVWRLTAAWSLAGIAVGQLGIAWGWIPSFLSVRDAQVLGFMGAFVLVFVIRMAGAIMEEKEKADERFRSLVQHSSDTTLIIDADINITYASPAVRELLGTPAADIVGQAALEFIHPDDQERIRLELAARLQAGSVTEPVQFRMKRTDGSWRYVEAVVSDLRDQPSIAGFVANVRDTTERKEAEDLLAHQALHDPLTGLPNRTLILDRAGQMLVRARRELRPVAALFVDLDNFKEINDTLGHEAGDKILQAVAERFTATLRGNDTVGRLGGDEFVVLAEGLSLAAGAELVAERIQDVLREPFRIDGYEGAPLRLSASVGIAVGDRDTAQDLLRDADIALYRAKALGKNRCASFEPAMQSAVLDRLELTMDLHAALAHGEFFVLYQPVLELADKSICGVEALLRWRHPIRGVVMPEEFMPLLEDSGLILEVGRVVLQETCRQAAEWNSRGHALTMALNVSMRQLETDDFVEDVREAIRQHQIDPQSLIIEVTETALMRDAEATVRRLRALKRLGVQVAIDDFGTGYSSLAYLQQFPVDALKIDRSFVAAMGTSSEATALIHTLIELGRALGLETLAEGIEDQLQLEALRHERCERGQGFLFSRAVAPEEIDTLLGEAPETVLSDALVSLSGAGPVRSAEMDERNSAMPD